MNHKGELGCCEKTLYNYLDLNLFEARNIDLRRKVRYRSRKKKTSGTIRETKCRLGRTYDDFEAFIEAYPDTPIVEMDTVKGKKSGKVLLTLFFRNCSLMLAILLEASTQKCVKAAIDTIYEALGHEVFKDSFPVLFSDRGNEFKNQLINNTLETFKIERSLSMKGCPYDNAVAEATFKIVKTEFVRHYIFDSQDELEAELSEYVYWFNNQRIHSSLDYLTPVEYRNIHLKKVV